MMHRSVIAQAGKPDRVGDIYTAEDLKKFAEELPASYYWDEKEQQLVNRHAEVPNIPKSELEKLS